MDKKQNILHDTIADSHLCQVDAGKNAEVYSYEDRRKMQSIV